VLRLVERSDGEVLYRGEDLGALSAEKMRRLRSKLQIIFQDPYASLNPKMRIRAILGEALSTHGLATGKGERDKRIAELLELVGLRPEHADRFPHEFSGGQRQRIGVARALAVEPEFIVADEPLSALDVSIQSQVINLLADLRERLNLTMLFISHDLDVVEYLCDRVVVLYLGKVMEIAETDALFERPLHPYTRALLAAVPRLGSMKGRPSPQRFSIVLQQGSSKGIKYVSGPPVQVRFKGPDGIWTPQVPMVLDRAGLPKGRGVYHSLATFGQAGTWDGEASFSGTNARPASFTLNGVPCTVS